MQQHHGTRQMQTEPHDQDCLWEGTLAEEEAVGASEGSEVVEGQAGAAWDGPSYSLDFS